MRSFLFLFFPVLVVSCVLQDWIFSTEFIEENLLLSCKSPSWHCCCDRPTKGSRDSTIKLWSIETQESQFGYFSEKEPLLSRKEHLRKVRDLKVFLIVHNIPYNDYKYNCLTEAVTTLSADGSVKIWDKQSFDVVSSAGIDIDCWSHW